MIDTIVLLVPKNKVRNFNTKILANSYSFIPHNTQQKFVSGKYDNFSIRESSKGFFISGSIAKYIFKQNLFMPSLEEIETNLKKIAKIFGFDLKDAIVYRIDIAYNFHLNHKVKSYLDSFGNLGGLKKSYDGKLETITYSTKNKSYQVQFYHKILEMKDKGIAIPLEYKELKDMILRYELKLRKHVWSQLGYDLITANMIYEKPFFKRLVEKWYENYTLINKTKKTRLRSYVLEKPTRLKDALAAQGLEKLGYESVLNFIDAHKKDFDKTVIARQKKMIKDLSQNTDASVTYQLSNELDAIVKDVYTNCITNFTWPRQP